MFFNSFLCHYCQKKYKPAKFLLRRLYIPQPSSLAPHGHIPLALTLTPSPSSPTEKITHDKFCKIMEKKK